MKHLRLNIPEPCTVGWNNMQVTENGHYCSTCSKNIPELHLLSDAAIIRLYLQNEGEFCGRIAPTQLERIRIHETALRAQIGLQYVQDSVLKRMLVGGLIAFTLTSWNVAFADKSPAVPTIIDQFISDNRIAPESKDTLRNITIQGVVLDADNQEPVVAAKVIVELDGMKYGALTDFDGKYKLLLPVEFMSKGVVVLEVQAIDYKPKRTQVMLKSKITNADIKLELDENILIEGIIIREED